MPSAIARSNAALGMTARSLTVARQQMFLAVAWNTNSLTKSESISSRHSDDEQGSQAPDNSVRSQWGAERLRGHPELGKGQYALSSGFSDPARKSDDDRDHVAERRKGDEEVQPANSTTITEDLAEEESGCGKFRVLEFFFGH